MTLPTLNGPSLAAKSGTAKQLIIFLHGLGANGDDLIGLAPMFANDFPDAAFISPNAPFACDMAPFGYQWFSMLQRDPAFILAGVQKAAPILQQFIDQQIEKHKLTDDKVALVGFSQGCMMSLFVALRRKKALAGVIGYSGALVGEELLPAEITSKPPILLAHGDMDPVVPYICMPHAEKVLKQNGVHVESLTCPGLGHGIDPEAIDRAIAFLKKGFGI